MFGVDFSGAVFFASYCWKPSTGVLEMGLKQISGHLREKHSSCFSGFPKCCSSPLQKRENAHFAEAWGGLEV